jgi:hypothetical protein
MCTGRQLGHHPAVTLVHLLSGNVVTEHFAILYHGCACFIARRLYGENIDHNVKFPPKNESTKPNLILKIPRSIFLIDHVNSIADLVGEPHVFAHLIIDVFCTVYFHVVNKETIGKVLYSIETEIVVVWLNQHKMDIYVIFRQFVYGRETHLSKQGYTSFNRMQLIIPNFSILA